MKNLLFILALSISSVCTYCQTLGTKKNVELKLVSFGCGDFCYITLKDIKSGTKYYFQNVDDKTKDNGILESIQNKYYADGESDKALVGRKYKAVIEFRTTPEIVYDDPGEPGRKTGKKLKKWMINSLSK